MVKGLAEEEFDNSLKAIESSYQKKIYDEEFKPVVIVDGQGKPQATIKDNDAVIFFNFRSDRARELTKIFVADEAPDFRKEKINNLFFVTMTEYEKGLPVEIAFPPETINNPLSKIISERGLSQLHIAETEKYAHVTFFFNGGREDIFPNEKRILIPSPRISSYDQKPEMSGREVAHQVVWAIGSGDYQFIVVNFANADMIGHTGNLEAAIKAIEFLDEALGEIIDVVLRENWVAIIIADHGNVEEMVNLRTGEINKEHTTNPVPFIIVGKDYENKSFSAESELSLMTPSGVLADVAPTIIKIMNLSKPPEMSGTALI